MSPSKPHPNYPNPMLQEALCEVRFKTEPSSIWVPGDPAPLVKALGSEYPEMETVEESQIQIKVGPGMAHAIPEVVPSVNKLVFRHATNPSLIQVWSDRFSVNQLRPYPGWATFKAQILSAFAKLQPVLAPTAIAQVGMRFINRIERRAKAETPGYWLTESKWLPQQLLASPGNFLSRLEARLDAQNLMHVTVAHDRNNPSEPFGSLLFDLDRIYQGVGEVSAPFLEEIIQRLHDDVWEAFDSAKGDALERLLMERRNVS